MDILITGGSGFVGQYLVSELAQNKKNKISVLCRKRREFFIDIESFDNVKVHYGNDVLDYAKIEPYFKGKEVVFNLAGLVAFRQKDKKKLIQINHYGTLNVLRACEKHRTLKLIHLSSTATFGFSRKKVDENYKFNWRRYKRLIYSYSKYLPEKHLVRSEINTILVHPCFILGTGDKNTQRLIGGVKNNKIPFNPPGSNCLVDVRDLIQALVLIMKSNIKNERFIVVGKNYSFRKMNKIIAKCFNKKWSKMTMPRIFSWPLSSFAWLLEKFHSDPPVTYENVYLSFRNRNHNSDKIKKLGYQPKYSLAETIKDVIKNG